MADTPNRERASEAQEVLGIAVSDFDLGCMSRVDSEIHSHCIIDARDPKQLGTTTSFDVHVDSAFIARGEPLRRQIKFGITLSVTAPGASPSAETVREVQNAMFRVCEDIEMSLVDTLASHYWKLQG